MEFIAKIKASRGIQNTTSLEKKFYESRNYNWNFVLICSRTTLEQDFQP